MLNAIMFWGAVSFAAFMAFAAIAIVHINCTNNYRKEMDAIEKEINSIQWPIETNDYPQHNKK